MLSEERNITFLIYANVTGHDTDTLFGTNFTYTIRKDTISTRSTAFPNNYAETTSLCTYTECIFHFSNSEKICSSCIQDKSMSNIKETLSMYKLENVTATIKTDNFNLTICHESDNKFLINTENKSYSNFTVGLYICKSDHLTQYFICNECESQRYQMKCCFHSNLTDISNRSSVEEIPQCEVYTGSKTKIILASIAVLVATSMLTLFFVKQTDCYKRFKMYLRLKKIRENGDAKNKEVNTFYNSDIYDLNVYVKNMEDTYCTIGEARIMALEIQNSKNVLCIVNY
uniref:Uncharacterized protein n=1 Tax=Biomphalaria glabrata TaxID=6526 RepID=A0A2C9KS53_BIOGL